ncbi:MAG: 2-oxoacid:acceptor oxidoreductase family protein [Lachnospiraceae bacterium]|nr:2-oxoacid:acceptor oxidoreductase family protein [Lachnospiraceae bacterium]MBR0434870.1 2-oxoacid:acceptor oxidoreductase family protein [Lachnospiraceae bacterium]
MEIRLTGSGGQGVILATIILAEAGIEAGKHVAQSQAYGPEARGGSCKAEVIIDEKPIGFTKVEKPTFFMALTQKALNQYAPGLSKSCIVLLDDTLETPECLLSNKVYKAPILESAVKEVGKAMTANIVAVGAINAILNLVSDEELHRAVMSHVPKGTEELNEKALQVGMKLIKK